MSMELKLRTDENLQAYTPFRESMQTGIYIYIRKKQKKIKGFDRWQITSSFFILGTLIIGVQQN